MNTNKKENNEKPDKTTNWKLGFIYFNPNDRRVLVPKRWGIGWTLNFANPVAIVLLIVLIAIPIVAGILLS